MAYRALEDADEPHSMPALLALPRSKRSRPWERVVDGPVASHELFFTEGDGVKVLVGLIAGGPVRADPRCVICSPCAPLSAA